MPKIELAAQRVSGFFGGTLQFTALSESRSPYWDQRMFFDTKTRRWMLWATAGGITLRGILIILRPVCDANSSISAEEEYSFE